MQGILNISLDIIKSNWRNLNNASNGKAAAVIKANSYGLGMLQIAKSLIDAGCRYFYVANTEEAIILRKENPFRGDRNHLHHILIKHFSNEISIFIILLIIIIPVLFHYIFNLNYFSFLLSFILYLSLINYLNYLEKKYEN